MAFNKVGTLSRIPTAVTSLTITLQVSLEAGQPVQSAKFAIQIADQEGNPFRTVDGNLVPHLTGPQKTAVKNFLDALWVKAAEVLP